MAPNEPDIREDSLRELREIRLRSGLSQADLSAMTGVAEFTISEIESGKRANPRPSTLRKLAQGLGVEVTDLYGELDSPLGVAPSSQEKLFNTGFLDEERRTQHLYVWKTYLSRRVEWCERVLQKSREDSFNNPFLSLDTAIQWAIYVGIECTQLRNVLRTELRSYTDADSEIVGELHTLLDRFVAVDDTTNIRVKAMMDEAGLTDQDKEQRLRLIRRGRAA
jgi:transcriptional regulator with XRE-family HTH domain